MKRVNLHTTQSGFIALTSTMILSAVMMLMMFSGSTSSFFARFDALASEFKRVSLGLSESCSNAALLKLSQNYRYDVTTDAAYIVGKGVPVSIGLNTCYILSVDYSSIVYDSLGRETSKSATIKTSAQYPAQNGSWSTNKIKAKVQNPAYSPTTPAPTCSFTLSPSSINSGQNVTLQWATAGNATNIVVERNMGGVISQVYSGPVTGTPLLNAPSGSATYTATISGPGGSTQCVSPQSVSVFPSISCAETVVMLSGGMSSPDLSNEGSAVKTLLDLYSAVVPTPHVGVGSYGGLDGSAAQVPTSGQLTGTYGVNGASGVAGPRFATLAAAPNLWTNPSAAFTNDTTFSTSATLGLAQGYTNFGFVLPATATIKGVEVVTSALSSAGSATSTTLHPASVGNYDLWRALPQINPGSRRVTNVASNDGATTYIDATTNLLAQTYMIPGAGLPAGAVINSVTVNVVARETAGGGKIKLRVENGVGAGQQDDGADLTLNSTFSPYSRVLATNPITGAAWTVAEANAWSTRFGVVRTNATGGTPQVTEVSIVIIYTPPPGTLGLELSWNNGAGWTALKAVPLATTETAQTSGTPTDTWGRAWTPANFNDGNFVLRVTNNNVTGLVSSLNYSTIKVYYTSTSSGLYSTVDQIVGTINSAGGTNLQASIGAAQSELNSTRHQAGFKRVMIVVSDGKPNRPSGPVDREGLALTAADTAKADGIDVFTVHFGTNSGRDLVAQLATGVTANATHAPGSFNDAGLSNAQADINAENADSDDFFIAPTSADMSAIFDKIGKKVCPAAVPPAGGAAPAPAPPPPPLPPPITIGSWDEIISTAP